jgi:hypothetical protein
MNNANNLNHAWPHPVKDQISAMRQQSQLSSPELEGTP